MKIKLKIDLPIESKHGATSGKIFECCDMDHHRGGKAWFIGNAGVKCAAFFSEYIIEWQMKNHTYIGEVFRCDKCDEEFTMTPKKKKKCPYCGTTFERVLYWWVETDEPYNDITDGRNT